VASGGDRTPCLRDAFRESVTAEGRPHVRPRVAFGWLCDGSGLDGGTLFSQTATRWTFDTD